MKQLFILMFIITYCFFGLELGYTETSSWWTHFTYSFQHVNFWHLLLNTLSFFFVFRTLQKHFPAWGLGLGAWMIASGTSFIVLYPIVVVGASGMVYALVGMFISLVIFRKIHFRSRANTIVFFTAITTGVIMSVLKQNSAALLHVLCMTLGMVASCVFYLLKKRQQK